MNGGLAQGIIGRARGTLAPSLAALGPNRYLTRADFFKMLGAALLVHLLVFGVASLFPGQKVIHIPVRALSFKLGDQDRVAAYGSRAAVAPVIRPPVMAAGERVLPAIPPIQFKPAPVRAARPAAVRAVPVVPSTPAIAPAPQQYVREANQFQPQEQPVAAAPAPIPTTVTDGAQAQSEQTAQAIRERYEQQISSWIERHKFYPVEAGGRDGRVIVRMRIDRTGVVRYYALEQTSGIAAIDTAAIDMIRRANPVPAVPENYPAGALIEFLIPITFRAP